MNDARNTTAKLQRGLEDNLKKHIQLLYGPKAPLELASYALLPAGKLFRPLLALASAADQDKSLLTSVPASNQDLALICSFLEIHHAYTLVHDDLPAMDDDDMRRGRASHHIKFGEWKALLTGDALAIGSFHLLSKMKSSAALEIIKLATWATGPKGLIQGQYKDLSHEMNENFESLLETHLLKTARLIQLSLVLPLMLANAPVRKCKNSWKFGQSVGILFQLLDDLCELSDEELSLHEKDINPWPRYGERVELETLHHLEWILKHSDDYGKQTTTVLSDYFKKIELQLSKDAATIESHTKRSLAPVMSALGRVCTL